MKFKYGFSVIEIMIVVAIIGILSAAAIPSYKNYTIKAKISEGFSILEAYKPKIQQFFTENGRLPTQAEGDSLCNTPVTTNLPPNIIQINYNATWGGVSAYFKTSIFPIAQAIRELKLQANASNLELIVWKCGTSSTATSAIDYKYLPAICQNSF
jgi:type IV pilus assembly protein PilA